MTRASPYRLALSGRPDIPQPVPFRFNHRALVGQAGDSLAAALLANGVRTVGRSFKFHRPRGVYTCGIEEPNALVQLESGASAVPASRATLVDLYAGLEAFAHFGWPSLQWDAARILDFTAPLWAAGFYNKTFMWPGWHVYEALVRRMAGGGHAPSGGDPDRYDVRNLHCDVLVIGGGIAGLREAIAAATPGARVVLVDQGTQPGGRGAWDGTQIDGTPAGSWAQKAIGQLSHTEDVRILRRTTAVGYYEREVVTLLESIPYDDVARGACRERYWVVRAARVVLATGAIEQPLIFCNNDRPGILLAGAAHQYLRRYAVAIGRRVVLATNNDSVYAVARDLREAGVDVLAVADSRHEVPETLAHEMRELSIPLLAGSIPVDTSGFGALSGVTIGRLSADSRRIQATKRYACDALAVSGGWNPTLHLYSQAGGRVTFRERSGAFEAEPGHPAITLAGSVMTDSNEPVGIRVSPVGNARRQWVDLRHDVTVADLALAVRENYRSIEHVKRYTTAGMAADQGKTSHAATLEIVGGLRGMQPSQLGHTTFRPPFAPVTLGAIAGRAVGDFFAPYRRLPMHAWHADNGALFEDFGEWRRPAVYLRDGESRPEGIMREARAVRAAAGIFDGSPLGKIEVTGPDAHEFLDRFYINNLATLRPGRVRYGFMLRESGALFDDGTVVMLAPDHFIITTTSGNAGRVAGWLEEWHQCEWPGLHVVITPVTEQWANVTVAGPSARDILAKLTTDIDLANSAFPHLGMREGRLLGCRTRIYRVSFSGELTYEINVPAAAGQRVWDALLEQGKTHGLQAFGLDALLLLRLEKGFLHLGTDTDGTTVPNDVGYGNVASSKAADFIGKRSLRLPENVRSDRLQLIGLKSDSAIVVGSHLRLIGSREATDGWVTSAGRAVLTGEHIALALLRAGRQHMGAQVLVHDADDITMAKVVNPVFFDPAGERMHA